MDKGFQYAFNAHLYLFSKRAGTISSLGDYGLFHVDAQCYLQTGANSVQLDFQKPACFADFSLTSFSPGNFDIPLLHVKKHFC